MVIKNKVKNIWGFLHYIFFMLGIMFVVTQLAKYIPLWLAFSIIFGGFTAISYFYLNGGFFGENLFNEKKEKRG